MRGVLSLAAASAVAMGISVVVHATTDRVVVSRVARNLYEDTSARLLIETRLCLAYAWREDAVLKWEGRGGDSWLQLRDETCEVIDVRRTR